MAESKLFLWGAASASHQVEGGTDNDWTAWEARSAERLAREAEKKYGMLASWGRIKGFAENPENYRSHHAADHFRRFAEDFDIAKQLGHTAHRFSLEWSRIEPEEGKFDRGALAHYRAVIEELRARGMEPFVTLWHWTLPRWLAEQGGWENRNTIDLFARYAETVVKELGKEARFWITLNEPTVYAAMAYLKGEFPPEVRSLRRTRTVIENLVEAHEKAYVIIHRLRGDEAEVGIAHNIQWVVPWNAKSLLDRFAAMLVRFIRDRRVPRRAARTSDFFGVNYYYAIAAKFSPFGFGGMVKLLSPKEVYQYSDMGWAVAPEGLYHVLKWFGRFKKPIYVTENGIADAEDVLRADYIKEHLQQIERAKGEGVPVHGYFHWALTDNFEWDKGFWPRFGLVAIEYISQNRTIRNSATRYRELIEGYRKKGW